MYDPPMFQHVDPAKRQEIRRFKADQVSEDNLDDVVMWTGGIHAENGVTLPSGEEVPFGQWVMCQEGRYLRVSTAEFTSSFVPA